MKTFLGVGVLSPRRSEALTTNSQPSKRLVMCGIKISTGKLGSCGSSASRHDEQQKRASSLTLRSAASRRSSVVPAHPKRAAMPFSSKAREIHDHIVSSGKADYWIGVARSLVERKGQYQPGKPYARDVPALKEKLKAELSSAVKDANDNHWEEIAHWLVYEARSG